MGDKLSDISGLFFIMSVIAYALIVLRQHSYLQPTTYRLVVLSTRAAFMLPYCAFFILMAVLDARTYVMMMVMVTLGEGYCLYTFLALVVANIGGPTAVVELMNKNENPLLCQRVLPTKPAQFFRLTVWAVFHLIALRGLISLISAICFYANTTAGKQAYVVYNFLSAIVLLYGMICLISLYHNVYDQCINLFGVLKLALLKITVGAIVVQGLIENILYSNGTIEGEHSSLRAYCGLVLLELALLSVAYYYAFGDHRITPSPAPAAVRALLTDQRGASHLRASISGVREVETLVYSLRTFLYDVFSFTDILQISYFHVEGGDDVGLSEPLTSMLDGQPPSRRNPPPLGNETGGASRWILGKLSGYMSPSLSPVPGAGHRGPGGAGGGGHVWSSASRGGGSGAGGGAQYTAVPGGGGGLTGSHGSGDFSIEDEEGGHVGGASATASGGHRALVAGGRAGPWGHHTSAAVRSPLPAVGSPTVGDGVMSV